MNVWHPNRKQWWVIWAVYGISLLSSVTWSSTHFEDRPASLQESIADARRRIERRAAIDRDIGPKPADTTDALLYEAHRNLRIKTDPVLSAPLLSGQTVSVAAFDPHISRGVFLTFLVIGGALLFWRLGL